MPEVRWKGLATQSFLDCSGRVTHRLVLRIDGIVEIVDAQRNRALVDPRMRVCLTPGAHVADAVMDAAVSLINLA
jgi:hypothetical protein